MKTEHEYAQVLRWIADGETVQAYDLQIGEFVDKAPEALLLMIFSQEPAPGNFRIKPRTILINGREVPEPMRVAPEVGIMCWVADPSAWKLDDWEWEGDEYDFELLKRGLVHAAEEAAQAHVDALLSFTTSEQS